MKIYVASKTRHADMWKQFRSAGVPINSTWIDEAGVGETLDYKDLWTRCVQEASEADALILYRESNDDILKGALVEAGAALASGKPVYVVGFDESWSFRFHPLVIACKAVSEAIARSSEVA